MSRARGVRLIERFVGHGIGQDMHEEPQVPNFVGRGPPRNDIGLEPGIVLAIEPMVADGNQGSRTLDDGWTVETKGGRPSAHFERTVGDDPRWSPGAHSPWMIEAADAAVEYCHPPFFPGLRNRVRRD